MRIVVDRSQMGQRLTHVPVHGPVIWNPTTEQVALADQLSLELGGYTHVLLGRVPPPINQGILTLMEVAQAYYARANEMNMEILRKERDGVVSKGSALYRFRTGELRSFLDMTKKAIDLGSRRLTHEQVMLQMREEGDGLYLNDHLGFDPDNIPDEHDEDHQ